MRNLFFCCCLLFVATSYAQYDWAPAVITLNTGDVLEGESKLVRDGHGFNATITVVKYRDDKRKEKFNSNEVKSIVFTNTYTQNVDGKKVKKTSKDTFISVDTKKYSKRLFLQEISKGKLSLYGMPLKNYKNKITKDEAPYNLGAFSTVFIKKSTASADVVTVLGLDGKIQEKKAADYLSNCPATIEHIISKEGSINAVELAAFYNSTCSE